MWNRLSVQSEPILESGFASMSLLHFVMIAIALVLSIWQSVGNEPLLLLPSLLGCFLRTLHWAV